MRRMKLATNRPDPTSSTTASATSPHDKRRLQMAAARTSGQGTAVAKRAGDVRRRQINDRPEAHEQATRDRRERCAAENAHVDGNGTETRDAFRQHRADDVDRPVHGDHGERGSRQRQQQAFGLKAPHELPSRRTQCRADAQFVGARRRAREQQVGDVDAREQEHAQDCAEQQPHPRLHAIADNRIDERPHANAFVLEPGRVLRGQGSLI